MKLKVLYANHVVVVVVVVKEMEMNVIVKEVVMKVEVDMVEVEEKEGWAHGGGGGRLACLSSRPDKSCLGWWSPALALQDLGARNGIEGLGGILPRLGENGENAISL
ncbi:hypothetical protein L3X38_003257 [Prunus dulcis]|uniref:Uncharacterized protein n=1 Tax=Prunus dulcis TaxID=3755 RepID=A0AAD4ZLQ4_PRUDU|nr:hypothetical protein L3X38_003257 [Prunus dulcis]